MKNASSIAALIAFCFTLAGCEDGERASGHPQVDTLPGGAVYVLNPELGRWGDKPAWSLLQDLRIGTADGDGPESFGAVHAVEVDAYGRIYVLDRLAREVVVFDSEGRHVRTMGSGGSGPGEFQQPSGFAWMPDGQLWVEDSGNRRFTVFDTTGALRDTHARDFPWFGFRWVGGFDRQGLRYGLGSELVGQRAEDVLFRLDRRAAAVETIPLPPFEPPMFHIMADGVPVAGAPVPFAPGSYWALDRAGFIWFGVSNEYRLIQQAPTGDTVRIVEREIVPIPVSSAERAEGMAADHLASFREAGALDPSLIPDHHPIWHGLTVDCRGHLWVIRGRSDDVSVAFDVFDPEGIYLGQVPLALPTMQWQPVPVIRDDRLYTVARDTLGIQYVVRARIERPDGP